MDCNGVFVFVAKKQLKFLTFFCATLTTCFAYSIPTPWTQFGVRPLGMGNAFVAVVDDFNALFYNPAGLTRLTGWTGELLNPGIDVSSNTVSLIKEMQTLQKQNQTNISGILGLFEDEAGKTNHAAFFMTPYFVTPHWGMGLGLTLGADLVAHSDVTADFRAGTDILLPVAVAGSFVDKKLSLGVSTKLVSFDGVDNTFSVETISAFTSKTTNTTQKMDEFLQSGVGVGVDVGFLFTPIPTMRPTIGMSILDVGGTVYHPLKIKTILPQVPKNRPPTVNFGVSLIPIQMHYGYLLLAADIDQVNQPIHYSQKLNMGMEIGIGTILKFQTGLMAGYATGGIQLDAGLLKVRFATYVIDHGPVVGLSPNLVDRRYALQFKLLI